MAAQTSQLMSCRCRVSAIQGPSCTQLVPENMSTTVSLHSIHERVSKVLTQDFWLMQDASNHLSRGSNVQGRLARNSQLGRAQLDEYASRVMALDEEGESFVQKIHRLFTEAGTLHVHCCCMAILRHGNTVGCLSLQFCSSPSDGGFDSCSHLL